LRPRQLGKFLLFLTFFYLINLVKILSCTISTDIFD
jgi:hypothetical protein